MKKVTSLLVLTAIILVAVATPLFAVERVISANEFTAKTGLTVEDVIGDDDENTSSTCTVIVEGDDYYIVISGNKYCVIYR
jgi:hypothetical protein